MWCQCRLIPAHAGKTRGKRSRRARQGAHPRSRGENEAQALPDGALYGSSPLTRGKPRGFFRCVLGERLIPAHAGKTPTGPTGGGARRAHPRSGGENVVLVQIPHDHSGSSPLTRGKLELGPQPDDVPGLIPAHAGKTRQSGPARMWPGAHPRSRGENTRSRSHTASVIGSSPLTRGKPHLLALAIAAFLAHPRSRGENTLDGLIVDKATGSSPLTRGKLRRARGLRSRVRLIPAHAGKTATRSRIAVASPAHPRSRGENSVTRLRDTHANGSSPLTRGKQRDTLA